MQNIRNTKNKKKKKNIRFIESNIIYWYFCQIKTPKNRDGN